LRVARTFADLRDAEQVTAQDVLAAMSLREV
jgi:predicted ATPase with chaperone activity